MATARILPDVHIQSSYETWLGDVCEILATMDMKLDAWQENWEFDFRQEYDAGSTPHDAALRAHDFWWQQLLAESWT